MTRVTECYHLAGASQDSPWEPSRTLLRLFAFVSAGEKPCSHYAAKPWLSIQDLDGLQCLDFPMLKYEFAENGVPEKTMIFSTGDYCGVSGSCGSFTLHA